MTQQPPGGAPREPDPTDSAWVDHILDQLTSRPMPAAPDVEEAEPAEPAQVDETDVVEPVEVPPAVPEPEPRPEPLAALPPELPPLGLLDELYSMEAPPPEREPAAPMTFEPPPTFQPPPAPPPPRIEPPPTPVEPPPVPPAIPAPEPRPPLAAPRQAPQRGEDPMLAGTPTALEEPPARPRRRRATDLYDSDFEDEADFYEDDEEEFGEHLVESRSPWRTVLGWVITIGLAIALSLVIRAFVAHAFHVESGSMEPTLNPGDRILVNKLADNPGRGDLVVFGRADGDLVKRVVALAGETIYFEDGLVRIGERWLVEPYLAAGTGTYSNSNIPNCDPTPGSDGAEVCTIPDGHVFVLGDNRGSSFDSRNFGPVPREDLVGSAAFQFWPLGDLRGL